MTEPSRYPFRLIFFILLLLVAGIYHILRPDFFLVLIPSFVPFKIFSIIFTGVLEIVLALCLMYPPVRSVTARILAGYLFLLIPFHVYMAVEQGSLGNLGTLMLLWGRVLLQFPLIYLAWSLKGRK